MNSKFSKSGVFSSSPVDYFCLVCECRLRNENDANMHIDKPVHIKKFEVTDYFENKENCVRKIKKWYFCELCNLLLFTTARVRLHIVEAQHIENDCSTFLHRRGNFVIAFSNVLISDNAWNGIVNDTCVICNTEFDEENIHKNEMTHILKLIQTKVEFDTNKNVFRKVDENSFQCLTCNMVVALDLIEIHFNDTEHKNLYQNKSGSAKITTSENIEIPEVDTENRKEDKLECEPIKEAPDDTVVKNDNSFKKNNGIVKKSTVNIANSIPIDDTKLCEILGTKDYITTDENGMLWCILCNWVIDPSNTRAHIQDLHHQTMLELHKERISKLNTNSSTVMSKDVKTEDGKSTIDTMIENKTGDIEAEDDKSITILDSIVKYQKNGININFEFQTAVCKKCSKVLEFKMQAIEKHIQEHTDKDKRKDAHQSIGITSLEDTEHEEANDEKFLYKPPILKKKDNVQDLKQDSMQNAESTKDKDSIPASDIEKELDNYAKQNDMIYSSNKNKVYCKICNTYIPTSLKCLKEHVAGLAHKKHNENDLQVAQANAKSSQNVKVVNLIKICTQSFINDITYIEGFHRDVIINDKLCINFFSFIFMVPIYKRFRCLICDTNVYFNGLKQHIKLCKQETFFEECLVVDRNDNEFIREIRPGCFHCGYCNLLYNSWEAVELHLQSTSHKESRISADWRLQKHMPHILKRPQREVHDEFMMQMMLHRVFGSLNTSNNVINDDDCHYKI